jgi:hypothetical protein
MRCPAFSIGFDGEKGEARDRFGEKILGRRRAVFAGGFAILSCFVVVKLW